MKGSDTNVDQSIRKKSGLSAWYMFTYDMILFLGWLYVGIQMLFMFMEDGINSFSRTYTELGTVINWLHILVLFDLLHAPFGLWGPSDIPFFKRMWCKVGRRSEFYITLLLCPEIHSYKMLGVVFLTWAISDIARYPFYALSSIGKKPYFIVWLRYSVFVIQYPAVLYAEAYVIFCALPYLTQKGFIEIDFPRFSMKLLNYSYSAIYHQLSNFRKFIPHFNLLRINRRKKLYTKTTIVN